MQTSDQLIAEHKDEYGVYTSEEPNVALVQTFFAYFDIVSMWSTWK